MPSLPPVSVVIPAYNEADSIRSVVEQVRLVLEEAGAETEIIVVVDGATDRTADEARSVADRLIEHPQNLGYGRSLKSGILAAQHDLVAITDADRTYPADRIPDLIALCDRFDMVVGARTGVHYRGSMFKRIGRFIFRRLAEFSVGQKIPDINSGLRVFRKSQMLPFFPIISSGFSFTTTSTLAYMHNDLLVHYVPIDYRQRAGRSKVRHFRDSLRAIQIITEAILRCNPVKVFLLLAAPYLLIAVALAVAAVVTRSSFWTLCSLIAISTTGIVLGMGFLAVAVMPQRRLVDARLPQDVGEPQKVPAHDS